MLTSQPIRRPAAAAEGAFRLTEKQHHSTGWVLQWGKRAIRVGHRWEKATQLSDKHALHVHMQAMRQRVLSKTAPAQKGLVKRAEMPDGAEAMEAWWKKLEHTKWSLGYTSAALDKSRKNCLADGILESAVATSPDVMERFVSWAATGMPQAPGRARSRVHRRSAQAACDTTGHSSLEPPTGDVSAWRALIAPPWPLKPARLSFLRPWPGGVIIFSSPCVATLRNLATAPPPSPRSIKVSAAEVLRRRTVRSAE